MKDHIKQIVKKSVYDKLVEINDYEYSRHNSIGSANKSYPIGVLSARVDGEIKYFAYDVKEPPNFDLLTLIYKKTKQLYGYKKTLKF
jgi:hypothetical protein